jgi:hypothetical protein
MLSGDKFGAGHLIARGYQLLAQMKNQMSLGGLRVSQNYINFMTDTGVPGYIMLRSNQNLGAALALDEIEIYYPPVITPQEEVIAGGLLYLITIANPEWYEEGMVSNEDVDHLPLWKMYTYTVSVSNNKVYLQPSTLQLQWDLSDEYGLQLVMQEAASRHYGVLSTRFSQKEEIGSINPLACMVGWSIYDPGIPDWNNWWGETQVYGGLGGIVGSNMAKKSPISKLDTSLSARKNYDVVGDTLYTDLRFVRTQSDALFYPPPNSGNPGVAYFRGIKEACNPTWRYVYNFKLDSIDSNNNHSLIDIGTDQNNGLHADYDNWTYFVPIIAVAHDKALYRKVNRTASGDTCWSATIHEELNIGIDTGHKNIESITLTEGFNLTSTSIEGPDEVTSGTSADPMIIGYGLAGCSQSDQAWTVSGTGVTVDPKTGAVTLIDACGTFTITGRCISCGISASLRVRVTSGHWNYTPLENCVATGVHDCFPTGEYFVCYVGGYRYDLGTDICYSDGEKGCAGVGFDCGEFPPCGYYCDDLGSPPGYQVGTVVGWTKKDWVC